MSVPLQAYFDSEARAPQLARTLCIDGKELRFMLVEAIGKSTRARFVVKVSAGLHQSRFLDCLPYPLI